MALKQFTKKVVCIVASAIGVDVARDLGKILYKESDIAVIVDKLARQLNRDYKKQTPVLVGVLNGSFIFMADLVRRLTFVHEVSFVQIKSYVGVKSSGSTKLTKMVDVAIEGRLVLIVEDIVDSGLTINFLKGHLLDCGAKDVKVCTLLNRSKEKLDYIGFELTTDKFLVGYGLDFDNQFRSLSYIVECGGE